MFLQGKANGGRHGDNRLSDQPNLLGDQPPFAYDEENVPGDKVQFLRNAVLGLKTQEN
jgi:hypothetical protein